VHTQNIYFRINTASKGDRNMEYIKKIMQDPDGSPSSKRWVVLICSLALCGAFITSILYATKADPELVHAIQYIIMVGLGMSGAEKFAPKAP
jgi:hypothetical protein